jgi:threonine aldolase
MIDLRSDTVTKPTAAMRRAMAEAEVGDDYYGEDPTVVRLERTAAETLGFEAALFVPSGTMGNQVALRLHARPGEEVIVEARSHVMQHELGALAALSGILPRPIPTEDGRLNPSHLEGAIRPRSDTTADVRAIVLENTHNLAGGTVSTAEECRALFRAAHDRGLRVHVDGARIWNAAIALGVSPGALVDGADTAMTCLSKGLCCPVGSLVFASKDAIPEARRIRKQLGGGMRQAGIIAAAGLVALESMTCRLAEDHGNAAHLAGLLAAAGLDVIPPRTNIVVVRRREGDAYPFVQALRERGVRATAMDAGIVRFVTHNDVSRADCERAARAAEEILTLNASA